MVRVTTRKISDKKFTAKTLVVFVRRKGKKAEAFGADAFIAGLIDELHEDGLSFSELKNGVFLRSAAAQPHRHLLVMGVDEKLADLEGIRQLAASVYQKLKANKASDVGVIFDGLTKGFKSAAEVAHAFTEGAMMASHEFDFKTKKKNQEDGEKKTLEEITLLLSSKTNEGALKKAIESAEILTECVAFARELGNTPGNLLTPKRLAEAAIGAAKGSRLKVTAWDKERIKKERLGGLLGVSLGSAVDPRFIILEYNGGAKSKKPVCFVGKGLTFDSGGISIKPSSGMEEMKFDKCGGVNVIATMLAIARLKLKLNAVAYVPATENMPGPLANKPGDILTARNGKTVEVDNTDAEGRLILMDALAFASEKKPAAIFDAATLTGACVVALGNSYTGCFTRSQKVRKMVNEAAERSGERIWQMPLNDDHVKDMKGTYADLNNISSFKGAGSSTAAAFLEQFVDKDIPWAHFDIAGTAWHVGNRLNYCPKKGATGVMVRTFVQLAKLYS